MRCCKPSGYPIRITLSQVKGTSSNFLSTQECLFSARLCNQDGVQLAALRSLTREFPHRDCSGHVNSRTSLEIMLGSSHIRYHWHPFLPFLRLVSAWLTSPDSKLPPPVVTPNQSKYNANLSLIFKNSQVDWTSQGSRSLTYSKLQLFLRQGNLYPQK